MKRVPDLENWKPLSELLRSHSDDVRKSPKDYAVWMVRTKSTFSLLLVKLDDEGKFDEAWPLGSFSSLAEQRTFALEVARDFHVKPTDVM